MFDLRKKLAAVFLTLALSFSLLLFADNSAPAKYFTELGIPPESSLEQIKQAYKKILIETETILARPPQNDATALELSQYEEARRKHALALEAKDYFKNPKAVDEARKVMVRNQIERDVMNFPLKEQYSQEEIKKFNQLVLRALDANYIEPRLDVSNRFGKKDHFMRLFHPMIEKLRNPSVKRNSPPPLTAQTLEELSLNFEKFLPFWHEYIAWAIFNTPEFPEVFVKRALAFIEKPPTALVGRGNIEGIRLSLMFLLAPKKVQVSPETIEQMAIALSNPKELNKVVHLPLDGSSGAKSKFKLEDPNLSDETLESVENLVNTIFDEIDDELPRQLIYSKAEAYARLIGVQNEWSDKVYQSLLNYFIFNPFTEAIPLEKMDEKFWYDIVHLLKSQPKKIFDFSRDLDVRYRMLEPSILKSDTAIDFLANHGNNSKRQLYISLIELLTKSQLSSDRRIHIIRNLPLLNYDIEDLIKIDKELKQIAFDDPIFNDRVLGIVSNQIHSNFRNISDAGINAVASMTNISKETAQKLASLLVEYDGNIRKRKNLYEKNPTELKKIKQNDVRLLKALEKAISPKIIFQYPEIFSQVSGLRRRFPVLLKSFSICQFLWSSL